MKKLLFSSVLISILFIAGCGDPTPGDVLENVEKAHKEMESVEVTFKEVGEEYTEAGIIQIDKQNNVSYQSFDDVEIKMYKDDDGFKFFGGVGVVDDLSLNLYEMEFDISVELHKNPYGYMKQFDSDLQEKFEVEMEEEEIILTYNGDKEDQEKIVEKLVDVSVNLMEEGYGMDVELSDLKTEEYEFIITVDRDTNLIQKTEQRIDYSYNLNGEAYEFEEQITYEYSDYNEVEIERPDFADEETVDADEGTETEDISMGSEDVAIIEKEAGEYLDALIQATVFQDVEKYVKKDPSPYSKDQTLEAGEFQRDSFRQIYFDNTEANFEGFTIPDEAIEDLTDAFMKALSLTEYEIIGGNLLSDDDIVVTISVKGIDDQRVFAEMEERLEQVFEDEEFESDDDAALKNIEILAQVYKELEDVLDPVEVEVHVMRNEDGSYMVLLQDQYLGAFVQ